MNIMSAVRFSSGVYTIDNPKGSELRSVVFVPAPACKAISDPASGVDMDLWAGDVLAESYWRVIPPRASTSTYSLWDPSDGWRVGVGGLATCVASLSRRFFEDVKSFRENCTRKYMLACGEPQSVICANGNLALQRG